MLSAFFIAVLDGTPFRSDVSGALGWLSGSCLDVFPLRGGPIIVALLEDEELAAELDPELDPTGRSPVHPAAALLVCLPSVQSDPFPLRRPAPKPPYNEFPYSSKEFQRQGEMDPRARRLERRMVPGAVVHPVGVVDPSVLVYRMVRFDSEETKNGFDGSSDILGVTFSFSLSCSPRELSTDSVSVISSSIYSVDWLAPGVISAVEVGGGWTKEWAVEVEAE